MTTDAQLKPGDKPAEWTDGTSVCPKCKGDVTRFRVVTSGCGGYDDEQHECAACHHTWWVDGPDA